LPNLFNINHFFINNFKLWMSTNNILLIYFYGLFHNINILVWHDPLCIKIKSFHYPILQLLPKCTWICLYNPTTWFHHMQINQYGITYAARTRQYVVQTFIHKGIQCVHMLLPCNIEKWEKEHSKK
jgi:hypothetical protein